MTLNSMEFLEDLTKGVIKRLRKKYSGIPYQDVEDAVSDSVLRYLERFGNLDSIGPAWLYVAANNRLIDMHRREGRVAIGCPEQIVSNDGLTMISIAADSAREEIKSAAEFLAFPEQK